MRFPIAGTGLERSSNNSWLPAGVWPLWCDVSLSRRPRARTGHRPVCQTPKPDEECVLHSPCWILHPARGGTRHPAPFMVGPVSDIYKLLCSFFIRFCVFCSFFYYEIFWHSKKWHRGAYYIHLCSHSLDKRETISDTNKALCSLQSSFPL